MASGYRYDAFVSHAVEDKFPIANELCLRLEQAGMKIWYSGKELKVGDSLELAILKGLDESRYGIVILSPTYIEKNWTRKEFYLLMAKEIRQRKVILPILYNITNEDLRSLDISIADRWAISYDKGMDLVVQKLLEEMKGARKGNGGLVLRNFLLNKVTAVMAAGLLLAGVYLLYILLTTLIPSSQYIDNTITQRIKNLDLQLAEEHDLTLKEWKEKPATMADITGIYTRFSDLKGYYRNEYIFYNGFYNTQSRRNVEAVSRLDVASLSPHRSYEFTSPNAFLSVAEKNGKPDQAHYTLVNTQPLAHAIIQKRLLDSKTYEVTVSYQNNVRYILVTLLFPAGESTPKKHQLVLKGFHPVEKYIFQKHSASWALKKVD